MFTEAHFENFGMRFLWFLALVAGGWILTRLLLWVWEKIILPIVSKTESSLDDHLTKNLHKPVFRTLVLGVVYGAASFTIFPAAELKAYMVTINNLFYLMFVFFIARILNFILKSLIDWYMQDVASKTKSSLDDTLFPIFRKAGTVIIYFIAATVILGKLGVNLTGFLATAGVASLAIAFGAQETLANIIAGISILLDRSFHVGERIELKDGLVGDVLEIGLRSTRIISLDQRLIIVPNKEIAGSRLINWSQPNTATKFKVKLGVAMDEDLDRVKQIILKVCAKIEIIAKEPPAGVFFTSFGPYFIEVLVVGTVDNCRDAFAATDQLVKALQEEFKREKINLPFPQQVIQVQQDQ